MPTYQAPGVFVEEVPLRGRSIEGVPTSVAAFVGPTRYGPIDRPSPPLDSLTEFERVHGDGSALTVADIGAPTLNHLWHAARAFFAEGGKRLYVARAYAAADAGDPLSGHALCRPGGSLLLRARFPGIAGNARIALSFARVRTVVTQSADGPMPKGAKHGDLVWIGNDAGGGDVRRLLRDEASGAWKVVSGSETGTAPQYLSALYPPGSTRAFDRLTIDIEITAASSGVLSTRWADVTLDRPYASDQRNSIFTLFPAIVADPAIDAVTPIVVDAPATFDGLACFRAIAAQAPGLLIALTDPVSPAADRRVSIDMIGGGDGLAPDLPAYAAGLAGLATVDDINIVAAPGSTTRDGPLARGVAAALIDHAERTHHRFAIIDSISGQSLAAVADFRASFDSKRAALYYPWVKVADPAGGAPLLVPPSGFIAGIYARIDSQRGVWKAPANEVLTGVIGFETNISKGQQDVLNPLGINCLRFFEGRGNLVWGARTMSSDPEWKYVNISRLFAFLKGSIERGLMWAVFEPNGPKLWANITDTVTRFLDGQWRAGALQGATPKDGFFVRCDRTTMSQNDLDNGRLIVQIGVAPIKPSEFVFFRITQFTADAAA